jgi:DNA polymerase-3 subunit delta'
MVPQEGSEHAANAFLKLLEEPPPGTTLILTSSEPGALLPTIKSRVVSVRVPPLTRQDMEAFLADPVVERKLSRVPRDEQLARANGAPGDLFAGDSMSAAFANARVLLEAALAPRTPDGTTMRIKAAAKQGVAGARGAFSDTLDALTHLLHARTVQLVQAGRESDARRMASVLPHVEAIKSKTQNNVSPNLLTAALLQSMHHTLHP